MITNKIAIGQAGQGPQSSESDKVPARGWECQKRVLVTGSLSLTLAWKLHLRMGLKLRGEAPGHPVVVPNGLVTSCPVVE